jgi:hypothetical protein
LNWLDKLRGGRSHQQWLDRFDDDEPEFHGGPPRSVMMFVYLLAVSLAIGLFTVAANYSTLAQIASLPEIVLPEVLTIAFFAVLIWLAAWRRQQWALWALAIICAVRLLLFLPSFPYVPLWVQVVTAIYFGLQAAAFWSVFQPAGRRWFTRKKIVANKKN